MNSVTPIDAGMLARFEQGYEARPELNVMANAISRTALPDAAFVPAAAAKLRMDFSVLVKTDNITNQKQSGRCWMFSTLNVLRQRVIARCDLEDFSFSPTYLAFYDKLEKANLFLENILHFADQELTDRETYTLLGSPLPDGGQWDMAVSLIKKYGLVPSWVMPETVHSTGTAKYLPILNRKLREDALELRALVRDGKDPAPPPGGDAGRDLQRPVHPLRPAAEDLRLRVHRPEGSVPLRLRADPSHLPRKVCGQRF